jgi:hypothetical protein
MGCHSHLGSVGSLAGPGNQELSAWEAVQRVGLTGPIAAQRMFRLDRQLPRAPTPNRLDGHATGTLVPGLCGPTSSSRSQLATRAAIINLPLVCRASSVHVRWSTCRPSAMVTQFVTRRSPERLQAVITSAGGSDPPSVICTSSPAQALSCELESRRFSPLRAPSRPHVPWMCPAASLDGLAPSDRTTVK